MVKSPFPWRLMLVFLAMVGAGIPGVYQRLTMDPVTGTQPNGALWIAMYTFFTGLAVGAYPIAALGTTFGIKRFRPLAPTALLVSLVSLAAAIGFIDAGLSRPDRGIHLVMLPNPTSVVTWIMALYLLFGAVMTGMLWHTLRPGFAKSAARGSRVARFLAGGYHDTPETELRDYNRTRMLGGLGVLLCFGLSGGIGTLFSVLSARIAWHPGLFPITFLVTGLLSGAALVLAAAGLLAQGGLEFKSTMLLLSRLLGVLLVVECAVLPAEAMIVLKSGIPAHVAVLKAIVSGPHPWVFWAMQVGVGTLVPIILLLVLKRRTIASSAGAALLCILGVFAFRMNFVIPSLARVEIPAPGDLPMDAAYVPNLLEWNIVLFGIGLAGLLFLAAARVLPIMPEGSPVRVLVTNREREMAAAAAAMAHPAI